MSKSKGAPTDTSSLAATEPNPKPQRFVIDTGLRVAELEDGIRSVRILACIEKMRHRSPNALGTFFWDRAVPKPSSNGRFRKAYCGACGGVHSFLSLFEALELGSEEILPMDGNGGQSVLQIDISDLAAQQVRWLREWQAKRTQLRAVEEAVRDLSAAARQGKAS